MALNKRKVLEAARKHASKGAKAKALKEYNRLLDEGSRDAKLLLEVGDAYRRWGQNEEAIAQYGKVAQLYRQDGFDARAVAVFKQILNLDPKNYGAYVSLSELYQRMGLDSEAAAALQSAADGYHKEGRKPEALELLRQMAALDPTNTTNRLKVAELLRQEGLASAALAEYQAVVEELTNQQDRDQLIVVFERILEVQPDQVEALVPLVRNLMGAGEFERAEPLALRALSESADFPQYELLIDLYAQMGNDAKLADATRGLAKLCRDRGDEEKARELMQRLPAEEVGSRSRMAVDVSEVDELAFGDGELIGDDGAFPTHSDEPEAAARPALGDLELQLDDEEPAFEPCQEVDEPDPEASGPIEPMPVLEGDPDQLLAEANVYLRYGKRDRAIASLRGVLAQDPEHRVALEKLGEAYTADGQDSEAVRIWLKAAEWIRCDGDAAALDVLKERIAELDPAMVERIGVIETTSQVSETSASAIDLDLDVEVDLDLDSGVDDVAASETQDGFDFGNGPDPFEIEIDEDSVTSDPLPPQESSFSEEVAEADSGSLVEESTADLDASPEDVGHFELEIDADELSLDEVDTGSEEVALGFELDAAERTSPPTESNAGPSTTYTTAKISEELEEAEFYIAQEMYDEAVGILERVLSIAPNHPVAQLRIGEVAAARGNEPSEALAQAEGASRPGMDFETTARFDDETGGVLGTDDGMTDAGPFDLDGGEEDIFEIDVDLADADADADTVADAAETFDLRAALAEVLSEEDAPQPEENDEPGALSTVEDGFGSIFSDFKKGVTATLDEGDFDTRYDLGIAYREMELYEDAIGEFRICLDSAERRFDSLYLMGLCARDLSRFDDAVNHFEQALAMPDLPEDRMAGVYFDLSLAEEGGGDRERACAALRRVLEIEADFPGAAERLTLLEEGEGSPQEPAGSGQDLESFEELLDDDEDRGKGGPDEAEETFESFDDVLSEAEFALAQAELIEDTPDQAPAESTRPAVVDDAEEPKPPKKGARKKISFV